MQLRLAMANCLDTTAICLLAQANIHLKKGLKLHLKAWVGQGIPGSHIASRVMTSAFSLPHFCPTSISTGSLLDVIEIRLNLNSLKKKCPPGDLNSHDRSHWYLKPARLPIPPGGPKAFTDCFLTLAAH